MDFRETSNLVHSLKFVNTLRFVQNVQQTLYMKTYVPTVLIILYYGFLELRQTVFSAGYLRAEAEDTVDDITIGRDRSFGLSMSNTSTINMVYPLL
jgi:hypothetical protein